MYIIVSLKQEFRPTFTTACSFIVNKLCAADSNISPDEKKDGFYISIPWFRHTITDLAFGVLFHYSTRYRLNYLSPLELISKIVLSKYSQWNIAVPTVNIPKPRGFEVVLLNIRNK